MSESVGDEDVLERLALVLRAPIFPVSWGWICNGVSGGGGGARKDHLTISMVYTSFNSIV